MCGIFAYLYKNNDSFTSIRDDSFLIENGNKIQHRGPDNTTSQWINDHTFFMFHRLAIHGLDEISNQPIQIDSYFLLCNGEIYNYRELIEKYNLESEYKTNSDCEIIIHLFKKLGLKEMCRELNGEFAFILYDSENNVTYVGRDQLGIRPLFWIYDKDEIIFSSEMKSLVNFDKIITHFPPNMGWSSDTDEYFQIYHLYPTFTMDTEEMIINKIKQLFEISVQRRMTGDREIGCLLSGGLDSSTVAALVSKYLPEGQKLFTFSIGLESSPDVISSRIVSEHIGSEHFVFNPSEQELLEAIEKTIYQIESYDTTSIRASVGNFLISLFIRQNTNKVVIFNGDCSDELLNGYYGMSLSKDISLLYQENRKLIENIHYFDVLRSDRCIAGAGLEARTPFSCPDFVQYVMSIPQEYKIIDKERMEKHIFRKAFEDILPHEIVWRKKCAFSDAISLETRSWYEIIQEYIEHIVSDEEFQNESYKYIYNTPYDKESYYYRKIFEKYYPNQEHIIPYFWRQPFSTQKDPSARLLEKNQSIQLV